MALVATLGWLMASRVASSKRETTWTNRESWTSHSPGWNVLDVMKALEVGELGV